MLWKHRGVSTLSCGRSDSSARRIVNGASEVAMIACNFQLCSRSPAFKITSSFEGDRYLNDDVNCGLIAHAL